MAEATIPFSPAPAEVEEARENVDPLTNPPAADELPHDNLGRAEAANLMQDVFGPLLDMPAGIFDDLHVDRFLSDDTAVIAGGTVADLTNEGSTAEVGSNAFLLESTMPLRTENGGGEKAAVDLDLERKEQALEPANPLVDVSIPGELADGIRLSASGVSVNLADAPDDRSASVVESNVAFYPNVAPDTDFAVAPSPSGFETFTQLRTPEAPHVQEFALSLPNGARLVESPHGGAEVLVGDHPIATVSPPSAISADGGDVPASLDVVGSNSLRVTISPSSSSVYPIAIDPTFADTYSWTSSGYSGWTSYRTPYDAIQNNFYNPDIASGNLRLRAASGWYVPNSQTYWQYAVPRFFKDYEDVGKRPTTWIQSFSLSGITFSGQGNYYANPEALFAVSDTGGAWRTASLYPPDLSGGYGINLNEDHTGKLASFALFTAQNEILPVERTLTTQGAQVVVGDDVAPEFGQTYGPSGWLSDTAGPVTVTVSDAGLGVRRLALKTGAGVTVGTTAMPSLSGGECTGSARSYCPRTWEGAQKGNQVAYNPGLIPQGITNLKLEAFDPVNNVTTKTLQLQVDREAPELGLSGNLTEQKSVGTNLSQYSLKLDVKDGDEATAAATTPVGTAGTSTGQLERPLGIEADGAGNTWVTDKTNNRLVEYDKNGVYVRQISGTTGENHVTEPRDLAIDANGNLWVAETTYDRVRQYSATGAIVSTIKNAEMEAPYGVDIAPDGAVWVTDSQNGKVLQFKQDGTLIRKITRKSASDVPIGIDVDEYGNGWVAMQGSNRIVEMKIDGSEIFSFGSEGVEAGKFKDPVGVAIARSGNVFVSDGTNNRVQEFKPDGSFMRQFGTAGMASNQLQEPRGIAVLPGNGLAIADAANKRIARWNHADRHIESGAVKTEVKVDGTLADTYNPGCAAGKNCPLSREWTLNADNYSVGSHKVDVIATDAVGLQTEQSLTVETHGDRTAPTVALTGSITEQAALGKTLPTYTAKVAATDPVVSGQRQSGVAKIEIMVDGKVVDSVAPGCPAGGCSLNREWTLKSSSYSVGWHWMEVIATDAAGKTSSRFREFEIKRDTTVPELALSGALPGAPEGWVQEGTRSATADATDAGGYGVKQIRFMIDGVLVGETASQTCEAGGCGKTTTFTVNMTPYTGGAHEAVMAAEDGAGNVRKKTWTINLDPEGRITASEAIDTMEAFEDTARLEPVATTNDFLEPEIIEAGDNPHLSATEDGYEATGIPVSVTTGKGISEGFAIEGNDGQLTAVPVSPGGSSVTDLAGASASAVSSNLANGVDATIRPEYNGLMLFSTIREASSPTTFSWKVGLGPTQHLVSVDEETAEVRYEDGTEAFAITAEAARDAVGTSVPTHLTVEGTIITLTVNHRASGVVYPVVAMQEYATSYTAPTVFEVPNWEGPPPPLAEEDIPPDDEYSYITEPQALSFISFGLATNDNPPFSDDSYPRVRTLYRSQCGGSCGKWKAIVDNAAYKTNSADTTWWEGGTQVHARVEQSLGWKPFIWTTTWNCGAFKPYKVEKGSHEHLEAYAHFTIESWVGIKKTPSATPKENNFAFLAWVYPNGFQEKHIKDWHGQPSDQTCPRAIIYN